MCLISRTGKVETAKKDIKVFKMLQKSFGKFMSPYQYQPYKTGQTKTVKHFSDYLDLPLLKNVPIGTEIFQGLHSFTTKLRAQRELQANEFWAPSFIVEATIPKGTKYIMGDDGDIVSLKLTIGKSVAGNDSARKLFDGE
jgi:hypothetical protein